MSRHHLPAEPAFTSEWHPGLPGVVARSLRVPAEIGAPSAVLVLAVGGADAVRTALLSTRELRVDGDALHVALRAGSGTAQALRPEVHAALLVTGRGTAYTLEMTVRAVRDAERFAVATCAVNRTRVERIAMDWRPLAYVPTPQVAEMERWSALGTVLDSALDPALDTPTGPDEA